MSQLTDFLFGKEEKRETFPLYNNEQQDVFKQLLQGSQQQLPDIFSFLQNILSQSPEAFQAFEAPTRRAFAEQTLPTIAERFSGMNAQKSSAFGQQLGEAGKRLEESLAAQRAGMGFDASSQLQNLLGSGLTRQTENVFRPGTPGFLSGLGGGLASGLGQAGGMIGSAKLKKLLGL